MDDVFYVYEHWRSDKSACFYVGKGHGKRAYEMRRRNKWHMKIQNYLSANGHSVEVKIVADNLSEPDAHAIEIALIASRKVDGEQLVNVTLGGDGVRGLKHSEETRAKIRAAVAGKKRGPCSAETREKIRKAQIGKIKGPNPEHSARLKGRKHTESHRKAISSANMGRVFSEETRAQIAASNTGKKATAETKERLRISHLGNSPSDETRARMSVSQSLSWQARDRIAHRDAVKSALSSDVAKARMSEAGRRRMSTPEARELARQNANKRWHPDRV